MREYSPGVKGEFPVYHVDTLNFDADKMFADLERPEYKNCMVCCEFWFTYRHRDAFSRLQKAGECPNAGLLYTWPKPIKFFKAYGHQVVEKPIVWVTPEAIEGVNRVRLNVGAKFLKDYECFNVISKVEGERHDSCYVFTAHYDHVGTSSILVPTIMPPARQPSSRSPLTMSSTDLSSTSTSWLSPAKMPTCAAQPTSWSIPPSRSRKSSISSTST